MARPGLTWGHKRMAAGTISLAAVLRDGRYAPSSEAVNLLRPNLASIADYPPNVIPCGK